MAIDAQLNQNAGPKNGSAVVGNARLTDIPMTC